MNELVSVIIPTRNRPDLLFKAINSVESQTYKNLEIIIISDGSDDNTVQLLNEKYNAEKIIIIALEVNVGAAEARNIGINNAKGKYIAFLDDDDYWEKTKIEKQINVFQNNSDTAIVSCYFSKDKNNKEKVIKSPLCIDSKDILFNNYPGSFSFCMVKSEYLKELRINKTLRKAQDWFLWINILLKTSKVCRTVPEVLVKYNVNAKNRITQKNLISHFARIEFYKTVWDKMNSKQKYYNIKVLYNEKNSLYKKGFLTDLIISFYAMTFHIKSRYNIRIIELLRNIAFVKKYFV